MLIILYINIFHIFHFMTFFTKFSYGYREFFATVSQNRLPQRLKCPHAFRAAESGTARTVKISDYPFTF